MLVPANQAADAEHVLPGVIGTGPAMQAVADLTRRAAQSSASVLLLGESGTGKELIAAAVHQLSARRSGPFVRVNCGALSESLLESELFGHVRGSFTDAVKDRTGRFEAAHTGTIFLDEICSTSSVLQVKLLRVLQEREFERVGDSRTIRVDVRVIAASNRDLYQQASEGRFREDLFWRLNVVPIQLPPLRRRREDIPLLVQHFLHHFSQVNQRPVERVEEDALQALVQYHWPGNVRELQNYVERAVVLAQGPTLTLDLLPPQVSGRGSAERLVFRGGDTRSLIEELVTGELSTAGEALDLHAKVVNPVERELLVQVLAQCNQVQTKAAERLGINRNTLHKKMKEYGIE